MKHLCIVVAFVLSVWLVACGRWGQAESAGQPIKDAAQEPVQQASIIDDRFTRDVLDAAAMYQSWGRVSDRVNWSPWMCEGPSSLKVLTRSSDVNTHGRKLYYLFARDAEAYLEEPFTPQLTEHSYLDGVTASLSVGFGQAVVKQSWHAEAVEPGTKQYREASEIIEGHDGRAYAPGSPGPLFVMLKKDPGTPGTDEGWVYATLTPDGGTITGMGRMESCMGCHTKAPKDRLFGLKKE